MSGRMQLKITALFLFSIFALNADETPSPTQETSVETQETTPPLEPDTSSTQVTSQPIEPSVAEAPQKEINPSCRPQVQGGANLFVIGEYLFWQATEQKLIFAGNIDSSDLGTTAQKGKVQNARFNWASGFRFGLGYNTCHDGWDTRLVWTWLRLNWSCPGQSL